MGQIVGGLVAYGIAVGSRKHNLAIASWKIVFLVFGLFTACLGVVFWFVMPDNQLNARWLSKSDRVLAVARIRGNQQGIGMLSRPNSSISFHAHANIVVQATNTSKLTNSKKLSSTR